MGFLVLNQGVPIKRPMLYLDTYAAVLLVSMLNHSTSIYTPLLVACVFGLAQAHPELYSLPMLLL